MILIISKETFKRNKVMFKRNKVIMKGRKWPMIRKSVLKLNNRNISRIRKQNRSSTKSQIHNQNKSSKINQKGTRRRSRTKRKGITMGQKDKCMMRQQKRRNKQRCLRNICNKLESLWLSR